MKCVDAGLKEEEEKKKSFHVELAVLRSES